MKEKLINNKYMKNFYKILMTPSIRVLPGTLAYFFMMSIVPTITLASVICSKFSVSTIEFSDLFVSILPDGVEELLLSIFSGVDTSSFSVWFIILGFILASNGADAIILASNTLYDIDNENYIKRRIKALILTFVLMCLFLFILVVLAFGNIILKFLLGLKIFAKISTTIYNIFIVLKWPISVIIIFFLIKVIYTVAPNKKIKSKYVNKGTLFATFGLVLSTAVYSFYVNNIADYSVFYGNLSNIIVLMILIYVISYILVVGIAINTNIYNIENDMNIYKENG